MTLIVLSVFHVLVSILICVGMWREEKSLTFGGFLLAMTWSFWALIVYPVLWILIERYGSAEDKALREADRALN